MPVKTAMKRAIGIDSTPSRRICPIKSGDQVPTSRKERQARSAATPMNEMISRGDFTGGNLRGETRQRPSHLALAQPPEGAVAQLADPFAGDAEHAADLLEGELAPAIEAEVEPQHLGVTRLQGAEGVVDLLGE